MNYYEFRPAKGLILLLLLLWFIDYPTQAQTMTCDLSVGAYGSFGPCPRKEGEAKVPSGRLARVTTGEAVRVVMVSKAGDRPPWKGVLIFGGTEAAFDIVPDPYVKDRLVMRNVISWVSVYDWREITKQSGAARGSGVLSFGLTDYVRASADDVSILESSIRSLDRLKNWDRKDDRNCANDLPGHTSLFCLLAAAVEKRMGRYHHRQPALEIVREVIGKTWPDRVKNHPVMYFNNDPATTREDLGVALESSLALARAEARQKRQD